MKKPAIQLPEDGCSEVLLHACCAPCSSAIVEWMLQNGVRPTIFYYNPNIFPREEYDIRKEESKRHLEDEPERGSRCLRCFTLRLTAAAQKAQELGLKYFTTTLASSRWKSIEQITAAGLEAERAVPGTVFWAQNWRKGGLSDRRNQLLHEYGFYNQQYCGCEFSMRMLQKDVKAPFENK